MQTRFEWLAKQSIYKHLGYFSIHTLSSCHSEFELDTTAAVRSKHECILQLPPPTKKARQNLPIFHPYLLPCSSQLVFSVAQENQRTPEVQPPPSTTDGLKSHQKHPLNKTHPSNASAPLLTWCLFSQPLPPSFYFVIQNQQNPVVYISTITTSHKPLFETLAPIGLQLNSKDHDIR